MNTRPLSALSVHSPTTISYDPYPKKDKRKLEVLYGLEVCTRRMKGEMKCTTLFLS
jgi:hypothetical protein